MFGGGKLGILDSKAEEKYSRRVLFTPINHRKIQAAGLGFSRDGVGCCLTVKYETCLAGGNRVAISEG